MPREANAPLAGPIFREPAFNEGVRSVVPTVFATKHPSDTQVYKQIQQLLAKDAVGFDPARGKPDDLFTLELALGAHGPQVVEQIAAQKQIVFHALGDSGASNAGMYKDEVAVATQLAADCETTQGSDRPAFLFHLGDVVYDFGESQYYYDEFYDPFRNYPAPIFAIPGNHDSFVVPGTPVGSEPLTIFARNFCAEQVVITPEARSLHRTAMTQPGVYFTLDAPFVRIIGLFSNALEDPGVISSENGRWPTVPDIQLEYLGAQLERIVKEKYKGAVILAVHHPPFSYSPPKGAGAGGNHGSSSDMLRQIDTICKEQGVYPHAFLSGHAHNYQRYTRTVKGFGKDAYDVPFVVCGDGGHHVNRVVQARRGQPAQEPLNGSRVGYLENKPAVKVGDGDTELLLEKYDDTNYGYLRVTATPDQLKIGFHQVGAASLRQSRFDLVTVQLDTHQMVAN